MCNAAVQNGRVVDTLKNTTVDTVKMCFSVVSQVAKHDALFLLNCSTVGLQVKCFLEACKFLLIGSSKIKVKDFQNSRS